ncbi:MAG: flagellar export chaperone FlgN [Pirellulales bacterium]
MQPTEQLVELIDRKHGILVQLRDVGRRQIDFVASRDTASLIKLLATKQSLIASLQSVERVLAPFAAQDPENRVWRSSDERSRCAQQAADCNELLREIVNLEKKGIDQMTSHRDQIAEQLQQVHSAVDVRNAYQAQR